jgi:CBS-domain-containing membrane protein
MDTEQPQPAAQRTSIQPGDRSTRRLRQRLDLKGELLLALLPTLTILVVLGLVEAISDRRLLFASLASSAFLIYLDPEHGTNTVRTLVIAHLAAAVIGLAVFEIAGPGYIAGGVAMLILIVMMIVLDVVHPPAVSTALAFAFRGENERTVILFALAVGIVAVLVILQRSIVWLLHRLHHADHPR